MWLAAAARGDLDRIRDDRPGPVERLLAAEAAWLAIPPRRRPREFSAVLVGVDLIWDGSVLGYTPRGAAPCPACRDLPVGTCLVCSATAEDPGQWPLMDPSERRRLVMTPPLHVRIERARARRQQRAGAKAARAGRPARAEGRPPTRREKRAAARAIGVPTGP